MDLIKSIVYGFVSGISEFLPISSQGHQKMLKLFFGVTSPEPVRDMMIHIGLLLAILFTCGTYIEKLRREIRISASSVRRKSRIHDSLISFDLKLLKSALMPLIIFMIFFRLLEHSDSGLKAVAIYFLINGIIIYIPEHLVQGNKDSRNMSSFDGLLLGFFGSLCVLPGMSRIGGVVSCAISRGADRVKAYNWALILSIPAIILMLIFDLFVLFQWGFTGITFLSVLGYVLSGLSAFGAALAGIYLMRFIAIRSGFTAFSFYCWGAALMAFLLYLSV